MKKKTIMWLAVIVGVVLLLKFGKMFSFVTPQPYELIPENYACYSGVLTGGLCFFGDASSWTLSKEGLAIPQTVIQTWANGETYFLEGKTVSYKDVVFGDTITVTCGTPTMSTDATWTKGDYTFPFYGAGFVKFAQKGKALISYIQDSCSYSDEQGEKHLVNCCMLKETVANQWCWNVNSGCKIPTTDNCICSCQRYPFNQQRYCTASDPTPTTTTTQPSAPPISSGALSQMVSSLFSSIWSWIRGILGIV